MSTAKQQPEALQMADVLEDDSFEHLPVSRSNIAAELRRLHTLNQELLENMKLIAETDPVDAALDPQRAVRVARAAIAQATGKNEMTDNITLPREVVDQVRGALAYVGAGNSSTNPNLAQSTCRQAIWKLDHALRAALEQPQNHVPDFGNMVQAGWKLVPVEPTREMLDAGLRHVDGMASMPAAYRAMLAAAPQPPEHYDQQALDLCLTCGWKTLIPGDCCLNCARQKPQVEQEPRCLAGGARYKVTHLTNAGYCIHGLPREMLGKWVAFVDATDNKHMANPQPKREPLTVEAKAVIDAARAAMDESTQSYNDRGDISIASELADALSLRLDEYDRAIEAAHNIKKAT